MESDRHCYLEAQHLCRVVGATQPDIIQPFDWKEEVALGRLVIKKVRLLHYRPCYTVESILAGWLKKRLLQRRVAQNSRERV